MARNASGQYSLPSNYNPVVEDTPITVDWANQTLSDIATEITLSLDRTGRGAMTGQLQINAGTVSAPGLTFDGDTNCGVYRKAADDIGFATGGTLRANINSSGLTIASALQILSGNGTVNLPPLSFTNDVDTGIYLAGDGDMRLAVAGADKLTITAALITLGGTSTGSFNSSTTIANETPLVVGGSGVAFENSWAASGGVSPRYWKDALGVVHIDGQATHASGAPHNNVAFTLPSGYRPTNATQRFAIIDSNASVTYVTVQTDGGVRISQLADGRTCYLGGITFSTF